MLLEATVEVGRVVETHHQRNLSHRVPAFNYQLGGTLKRACPSFILRNSNRLSTSLDKRLAPLRAALILWPSCSRCPLSPARPIASMALPQATLYLNGAEISTLPSDSIHKIEWSARLSKGKNTMRVVGKGGLEDSAEWVLE